MVWRRFHSLQVIGLRPIAPCLLRAGGCSEFPVTNLCTVLAPLKEPEEAKAGWRENGRSSLRTTKCHPTALSSLISLTRRRAPIHRPGGYSFLFYTWDTKERPRHCTPVIEGEALEPRLSYMVKDCLKAEWAGKLAQWGRVLSMQS